MKVYEIVNPSDPYTLTTPSLALAGAATLLLGEGHYGLRGITDETERMPVFLFGGHEAWCTETGIGDIGEYLAAHVAEIADALDTVLVGSATDRATLESVLSAIHSEADREAARAAWHDKRRSSMNDIGAEARRIAATLRKKAATGASSSIP